MQKYIGIFVVLVIVIIIIARSIKVVQQSRAYVIEQIGRAHV